MGDFNGDGKPDFAVANEGSYSAAVLLNQPATINGGPGIGTILNDDAASVTNVSATTPNGSYKAGAAINVTIQFNGVVAVTGTPQLILATSSSETTAVNYTSGSGTNTLIFAYVVAAGDGTSHLDYASNTALFLNGGSIMTSSVNAVLTLAAPGSKGSLSANTNLVIDTTPPTSSVTALPTFSPTQFTVHWSGTDTGGSGVATFDVFVSDNFSPFTALLTGTTLTSALFTGQSGHSYGFYSVATDNAGNRQTTPAAAQATTVALTQVAAALVFGTQPSNTLIGQTINPFVTVRIVDPAGNLVTTDTSFVTLSIGSNPGSGMLGGTTTVQASGGIATFTNLSINNGGNGYTLVASDSNLGLASTSNPFNVAPLQVVPGFPSPSHRDRLPALQFNRNRSIQPFSICTPPVSATIGTSPDVTLVGAANGNIQGTLFVNATNNTITFVKTGGILSADTYTVTFRSASDGFTDNTPNHGLLDGNDDGIPGDNFTTTFTVAASTAPVLGIARLRARPR